MADDDIVHNVDDARVPSTPPPHERSRNDPVTYGREPSPVTIAGDAADRTGLLLKMTSNGVIDDIDDGSGHEQRPKWVTVPDRCKTMLWLLVWVIVATTATVSILALGTDPYCYDENDATLTRRMQMESWMDPRADPCVDFYRYTCGRYSIQYRDESVFGESQNLVIGMLAQASPATNAAIQTIHTDAHARNTTTTDFTLAGLFGGCVEVQVDADYRRPGMASLYIYTPCDGSCWPQRHATTPVHIPSLIEVPPAIPVGIKSFLTTAFHRNVNVYWFPPNNNETSLTAWYTRHCTANNSATPAEMWNGVLNNTSPYRLGFDYYHGAITAAAKQTGVLAVQTSEGVAQSITTIIGALKLLMIDYIEHGATFAGRSSSVRAIYKARIQSMTVNYGAGEMLIPSCDLDVGLYECLVMRWTSQLTLIESSGPSPTINTSNQWPLSGLDVNAVFNPINNEVYIPYALATLPFYSPLWPVAYQIASIGGVIAHEMGHAIRPGWNFVVAEGAAEMAQYETCIIDDYNTSGSERPLRTLNEDFADAISLQTIIRYFRRDSVRATKLGFILAAQTWCAAGSPKHYPETYLDPHAAPYLRVNSTVKGMTPFYTAFECPAPPSADIC